MTKRLVPEVGSIGVPVCMQSTQRCVFGVRSQNLGLPCSVGMQEGWENTCTAAFSLCSHPPRCWLREGWGSYRCPFPACRYLGGSEQCGWRGQQILGLACCGQASSPLSHQGRAATQRFGKKEAKIGMAKRLAYCRNERQP